MTRYLISFPSGAMDHIPDEEKPAVGQAAHAVVREAMDALGMPMHILVPAVGFYLMHAWVWKHNPAGIMADWNPNVSCP